MTLASWVRIKRSYPTGVIGPVTGFFIATILSLLVIASSWSEIRQQISSDGINIFGSSDVQLAMVSAAEERLKSGDTKMAIETALRVLARSPVSAPAVRLLAQIRERQGNQNGAARLIGLGSALGWRDPATQIWLASSAMQSGDYRGAATRIDALARVAPSEETYSLIDAVDSNPSIRHAIVTRLMVNPAWRLAYFDDPTPLSYEAATARGSAMAELIKRGGAPSTNETVPTIMRLYTIGAVDQARDIWLLLNHSDDVTVFDGRFQRLRQGQGTTPFEWSVNPAAGIEVDSVPMQNSKNYGLHIVADETIVGVAATQVTLLKPGPYYLDYDTSDLSGSLQTFAWSLRCNGSDRNVTYSVVKVGHSMVPFSIPNSRCRTQTLELRLNSSVSKQSEVYIRMVSIVHAPNA